MSGDATRETAAFDAETEALDSEADRFDTIEWDEIDADGDGVSPVLVVEALVFVVVAAAFAYDYLVVANDGPLLFDWDVTSVEWLFLAVLVLGAFHVVAPLARNRRMTAYYWRQFRNDRLAVVSAGYLCLLFLIGVFGPIVWAAPNGTIDYGTAYAPPVFLGGDGASLAHALGTDAQGRHLWHLIVYGIRVSFEVGLISTAIAITLGTVVGAVAANVGGYVDEVLMRYVDIQQTFPVFVLLVFLVYLFDASLLLIVVLYGVFGWEGTARLVRSEALQRSEETYTKVAEAAGASHWWVVRRHVIPNVSSTVITAATLSIPVFILGEATLSFLGFGDPSTFSWGRTINAGRSDLDSAWWISTIPGVVLFLTVLAFNFTGDALRDAVDPRTDS
ncbi:ABC transporter permease [Salinigranum salinum]|uniref:ABC transporter permease n=1 Tax=Salinigranum salinum TaxID=1364937 RepID=UPI00126124B6|nr:ABC transporter permease [Salinigranum salinum]